MLLDFKIERQMYNKLEQNFPEFYIDNVSQTWPASYRHRNSPSISAIKLSNRIELYDFSLQMSGRIFLVIFFFWALLAIVTPTLVLLSESSAPYLDLNVEKNGGGVLKPRRMMRYFEKQPRIEEIALASILQAPTPAPVPEPEPVSGIREVTLTRFLKRR
ncbi:hypothetical protein OIU78_012724 [Salix suchowensis]|nr:hypothetical protein OIU78_012724 [Salix suchowensis]KAJ6336174.1 hypothetical protein OIU78_012724 [Salix suchowensis]